MTRTAAVLFLAVALLAGARPPRSVPPTRSATYQGTLGDGATYLIQVPAEWNGTLVLYSHGCVAHGSAIELSPRGEAAEPARAKSVTSRMSRRAGSCCIRNCGKTDASSRIDRESRSPGAEGTHRRFVSASVQPGAFSCPNEQDLYLVNVTYARMTVTGSAGDTLAVQPDPIAASLKSWWREW